jgi:putative ABC transport system substrate-binding protein
MQLIRETFPQQKRIGAVFDRRGADIERQRATYRDAARHAGLELAAVDFNELRGDPENLRELPARRHPHRADDAFVHADRQSDRSRKIRAAQQQLALVGYRGDWAEAGALLTYGTDGIEALKRSADLANRVLKGSRPGETPVEQITKLELVVNMSSAKTLGVTIPRPVLARANRVLE